MRAKLLTVAVWAIISSAATAALAIDKPDRSDQGDQIGLDQAFAGDAAGLQRTKTELNEDAPLDVTSAFADGTLVPKAEALAPLVAMRVSAESANTVEKHPKAYVATATIWSTSNSKNVFVTPDGHLTIPVCWQNLSPDKARGAEITKQAVHATWEFYGLVKFQWSDKCTSDTKGIKIFVEDGRPWSYYGVQSEFPGQSMSLNFTFDDAEMSGCKAIADQCIWSIAVHEFGHAIGYIHEQDSPKIPDWCKKQLNPADIQKPDDSLKAKMLTDWDQYSVMDYCFDIYKSRVQLSDCDIAAYRQMYGTPRDGKYATKCRLSN
jgi:hypothetical protein